MLVEPTETNIVIFYLVDGISEEKFMADLEEKGVRISNMGHGKLRIVTHQDYTSEMHDKFVTIIRSYSS
jgi:threonine aldolase